MGMEAPGQIGLAEPLIVAVDNGGTNTQVQLRRGEKVLGYSRHDTPADYEKAIYELHLAVQTLRASHLDLDMDQKINAIGISAAGKVLNGRIVSAGVLQENGWVGKAFQEDVAQEFELESGLVVVMNDCKAAALAERVHSQKTNGSKTGYIETISTGNGGAGFDTEPEIEGETEIEDEPGHEHLKSGAMCGCGIEGHVEAHIGGSGIEKKFGVRAEHLPLDRWAEVIDDTVEAHVKLINRLANRGFRPSTIYFFGSVATKQPHLLLPGLHKGLRERRAELPLLPTIAYAAHGDDSGLVGAGDAALELLAA